MQTLHGVVKIMISIFRAKIGYEFCENRINRRVLFSTHRRFCIRCLDAVYKRLMRVENVQTR